MNIIGAIRYFLHFGPWVAGAGFEPTLPGYEGLDLGFLKILARLWLLQAPRRAADSCFFTSLATRFVLLRLPLQSGFVG